MGNSTRYNTAMLLVQAQPRKPLPNVAVGRLLGWFTRKSEIPVASALDSAAEEFDFYAAEEALLDS